MPTTTELTNDYIFRHSSVKNCLKKGLINYSALARLIADDIGERKKTSNEAILIAARRFKEKLKKDEDIEKTIIEKIKESNTEIKNNIVVFTLEKNIYPDSLIDIEREIKKEKALFFSVEGTKTITLIIQRQNLDLIEKRFKHNIIEKKENLSLITIAMKDTGKIPGIVSYISTILFENNINIEEFMSCYDDTIIVIRSEDIPKIMQFLNF